MLRFLKKRWKSHKSSKNAPETLTHQITDVGAGNSDGEYLPRMILGLTRPVELMRLSGQVPITEGVLGS